MITECPNGGCSTKLWNDRTYAEHWDAFLPKSTIYPVVAAAAHDSDGVEGYPCVRVTGRILLEAKPRGPRHTFMWQLCATCCRTSSDSWRPCDWVSAPVDSHLWLLTLCVVFLFSCCLAFFSIVVFSKECWLLMIFLKQDSFSLVMFASIDIAALEPNRTMSAQDSSIGSSSGLTIFCWKNLIMRFGG